jgi:monosaccharide-transporting ATPase
VTAAPLLETRGVGKSFGAVHALRGVDFAVRAGEVHGLMGENGAGKSTLIKVLTGFHRPDSGEVLLGGKAARFDSPREAQRLGVAAVYQEINLIPERSVAQNVFLGREPRRGLLVDRRRMEEETARILARYGLAIEPGARLRSLGLGLQQMVSIARTVSLGARVVVMDEPSSALNGAEVEVLFGVVEALRGEGIGVVFVSHRLSECYRLCDRLTVLRDGRSVCSATPAELGREALVAAMLGREAAPTAGPRGPEARDTAARDAAARDAAAGDAGAEAGGGTAPPRLAVRGLSWRNRVRDVSLAVGAGEIVGLAGLLGSGRTETLKAIFGAERRGGGEVELAGAALPPSGPAASLARGLGFLSEDRRAEGIFPGLSVRENLTASVLPRLSRWGVISRSRQDALVARYVAALGIRTAGPGQAIAKLSGGNQQKVLLARCLCAEPLAVMLDDPTRGIDVGAKAEVHRAIRAMAQGGLGVLVTSSEVEELLELANRLVVLAEGEVAGGLPTAGASPEQVLALFAAPDAGPPGAASRPAPDASAAAGA